MRQHARWTRLQRNKMFTYSWVFEHRAEGGEDENFSSLTVSLLVSGDVLSWRGKVDCSIASWTEWHCLHSLSSSLLLHLLRYTLVSPSSSLHSHWQHKLHSSAVFPHCRSRSCMSSAYLRGMGLLKGNATSGVSVCTSSVHPLRLLSSPPLSPTPYTENQSKAPPLCKHNSPSSLHIFYPTAKAALKYGDQTSRGAVPEECES